MTIGFCNTSETWGGGEKWHFETANWLHGRGCAIRFFHAEEGDLAERLAESTLWHAALRTPTVRDSYENCLGQCEEILRRCRLDALVLNGVREVSSVAVAARRAGVPRILFRRGFSTPVPGDYAFHYGLRTCVDTVLVNSRAATRHLPDPAAARLLPNWVDIDAYAATAHRALARPESQIVFGCAARYAPEKNLLRLVETAVLLRDQGLGFQLLLAGEGPERSRLTRAIRTHGLEDQVRLCGFVPRIKDFLECVDVFVFPSLDEGSPNAVVEAGMAGLPVVAFAGEAMEELIDDGGNGWLVAPDDVPAFAARCAELASQPDRRRAMGRAALNRVRERHDARVILPRLLELMAGEDGWSRGAVSAPPTSAARPSPAAGPASAPTAT